MKQLSYKELLELPIEEKYKIYFNYLWKQLKLKYEPLEFNLDAYTEEHFGNDYKKLIKYPNLDPSTLYVKNLFNTYKDFDTFCNGWDDSSLEGLIGHYWRFYKEIKL